MMTAYEGDSNSAVIADQARSFGKMLGQQADAAGGEQVLGNIAGEDMSKGIVDTEARLRSRIALRERMMEVLQTRRGTVAELVEAERSVAQINEEIDQARSWLEEMRGRVAFSRMNIDYGSAAPVGGSFLDPVTGAIGSIGSISGYVLAMMIMLLAAGIPLGAGVIGVRWIMRRKGRQLADLAT